MTKTLTIDLPRKCRKIGGGEADKMVLREPELRDLLVSEAHVATNYLPHTIRARDISLISQVSKIEEAEIRTLPVSVTMQATDFLRGFIDKAEPSETSDPSIVIMLDPPLADADGLEYSAIHVSEPTTGDIEAAERALSKGVDSVSMRRFQMVLLKKCGDLPGALVPSLPVSVVDQATSFCQAFTQAVPATGAQ